MAARNRRSQRGKATLHFWLDPKTADAITDGETGYLVSQGTAEPFAQKLDVERPMAAEPGEQETAAATGRPTATVTVPLIKLAYGRSGDKGNAANIGVLARKAEYLPWLRAQLTADAVKQYFAHFVGGKVERFEIPGLHGFNFLMQDALGGGGMASLRYDPQGKMLAQILMDFPVRVPADLV